MRFGMEAEDAEKKVSLFEKIIADYNQQNDEKELYLQMAIGVATYNPETDKGYIDVFRRADSAMYEDKKQKRVESARCRKVFTKEKRH